MILGKAMITKNKHAVKSVLVSMAALLIASCRMGRFEHQCLPRVAFQNQTLAECINQLKTTTNEVTPNKEPLLIVIDHSPATLVWKNISPSNSNEASRLESKYIHDTQAWVEMCSTNRISFSAHWIALPDVIKFLADMSGGVTYSRSGRFIIRYGAPKLTMHQYSHKGWFEVMDERRRPDNAQFISDLMLPSFNTKALISYVPATDDILVLGTKDQQDKFRVLIADFKCNQPKGEPGNAPP